MGKMNDMYEEKLSRITEEMRINDNTDDLALSSLIEEAESFLLNQSWCTRIVEGYLSLYYEGILAVFKYEIEPNQAGVDKILWVIVGDIPPAYIVTDDAPNGLEALKRYVEEMKYWILAVRENKSLTNIIPVNAPATNEYADLLEVRLNFILDELITS